MRYDKTARQVPTGLLEQDNSVCARRDFAGDLGEMKVHSLCVAGWQNQSYGLAVFRADGAKDVGRSGALVARCTGARAAFGPTPCDLVLLADTRLVWNQISIRFGLIAFSRTILSRLAGKFF